MRKNAFRLLIAFILCVGSHETFAQGTAFTYQGRLNNGGSPANGSYDLTFTMYATNSGGSVFIGPLTNSAVGVTNGLFTVPLDFGSGIFDGNPRWLEIGVRTNGSVSFTTLSPRQQLTPTPYAIFANTASQLTGNALQQADNEALLVANNTVHAATNTFVGTVNSIVQSATNTYMGTVTNIVTSQGYVTSSITNGLATTNDVDTATNNLLLTANANILSATNDALATATNSFLSINTAIPTTNGFVTATITNGLASTDFTLTTATNVAAALTNQLSFDASGTAAEATNAFNTGELVTATNNVLQTATNSFDAAGAALAATNNFVGTMNGTVLGATNNTLKTVTNLVNGATNNTLKTVTNLVNGATNNLLLTANANILSATNNALKTATNLFDAAGAALAATNAFASGELALSNLGDVVISSPVLDQMLKYNGSTWVNGNPNPVSAGAGIDFFTTGIPSDVPPYFVLSKAPFDAPELILTNVINNSLGAVEGAIISPTNMDVTTLDAGIWTFHGWGYANIGGHSQFVCVVYDRTADGIETPLFSATSGDIPTSLSQLDFSTVQQGFTLGATDRLVFKVFAQTQNTNDTTIYYYNFGTAHYSYIGTPLIIRHNDLSGLQGGTAGEYYHLSAAEYAAAISAAATNGTYPGMSVGTAVFATNVVSGVAITNAFITNSVFYGDGGGLTNIGGTIAVNMTNALNSFTGSNITYAGTLIGHSVGLTNAFTLFGGVDSFFQALISNTNTTANASSDWVAQSDNGNNSQYYVDLGINGSGYSANFWGTANDAYLYYQGAATNGGPGGNFWIGNNTTNGTVNWVTLGTSGYVTNLTITPTNAVFGVSVSGNGGGLTNLTAADTAIQSATNNALATATNSFDASGLALAATNAFASGELTAATNNLLLTANANILSATNNALKTATNSFDAVGAALAATNNFVGTVNSTVLGATNNLLSTANANILSATNNVLATATNSFDASGAAQAATNNFGNSVPVTMTNAANSFTGSFTGNGGGLINVSAATATNVAGIFANNYFVDCVNGNDTNNGSISFPWATLTNAEVKLPSGSTLHVASGNYFADNGVLNHFTFTNGITLVGNGINNTLITNILSIGNATTLKNASFYQIKPTAFGGQSIKNLIFDNITVGATNGIDCILLSFGAPVTNAIIRDSTFIGVWDVDRNLINATWDNNNIITLNDTYAANTSKGMHAHSPYASGFLTLNGGVVNINAVTTNTFFTMGNTNAFIYLDSNNPEVIRIYGTVFNHSQAVGANPVLAIYNPYNQTNIFGWYWDNGILTFVNGTNIYQPYNLGSFTGSGSGLTNLNYNNITNQPAIPTTNGFVTSSITNGLATTDYADSKTNGYPWGSLYDAAGAASSATNAFNTGELTTATNNLLTTANANILSATNNLLIVATNAANLVGRLPQYPQVQVATNAPFTRAVLTSPDGTNSAWSGNPIFTYTNVLAASNATVAVYATIRDTYIAFSTNGAITLTLSNSAPGLHFNVYLTQSPVTGNNTVNWFVGATNWDNGTAPTLTTNAGVYDSFTFAVGTNNVGAYVTGLGRK